MAGQLESLLELRQLIRDLERIVTELTELFTQQMGEQARLQNALAAEVQRRQATLNALDQQVADVQTQIDQLNQLIAQQDRLIVGLDSATILARGRKIDVDRIPRMLVELERQLEKLRPKLKDAIEIGDQGLVDEYSRLIDQNVQQQEALSALEEIARLNGWDSISQREVESAIEQVKERKTGFEKEIAPQVEMRDSLQAQRTATEADTATQQQIEADLVQATDRAERTRLDLESARLKLTALRQRYEATLQGLFSQLDIGVPIVLLPVRLETRFSGGELLVRIYPDDIHQDSHEPKLTSAEATWRQHFLTQQQAGNQNGAWKQIVEQYGAPRASYIVSGKHDVLTEAERRQHATQTALMPDRWVAVGYTKQNGQLDKRFLQWGELIPQPLKTGMAAPPSQTTNLQDWFDAETRWLIDFNVAVDIGMGIRIPLTNYPDIVQDGLSLLVVFGVKATQNKDDSQKLLDAALIGHAHTWGMGLSPQGTPTNNMEDKSTPSADQDAAATAWMIQGNQLENHMDSDGYQLARLLGIDYRTLDRAEQTLIRDQQDAASMNTVLYPATWGYFLSQMVFTSFNDSSNAPQFDELLRRHFIDYGRARGPLPVLRIHKQPYGVLPVSSLTRWSGWGQRFEPLAITILKYLREIWSQGASNVARMNSGSPNEALAQVLSLQSSSRRMMARPVLSMGVMELLLVSAGEFDDPKARARWDEYIASMRETEGHVLEILRPIMGGGSSRLFNAWYDSNAWELDLPLVQASLLSETQGLTENYIKLLYTSSLQTIYDLGNDPNAPRSLLFKLLRHSLLLVVADMGFRIQPLAPDPQTGYRTDIIEPELLEMQTGTGISPTAWRYLQQITLTMPDGSLATLFDAIDHYLKTDDLGSIKPEQAARLVEFRNSLIYLDGVPSAKLERLLTEALDLCSYRLDAWITSSVTGRLNAMRNTTPNGIQLGGYGWVEDLQPNTSQHKRMIAGGYVHAPSSAHATTAALLRSGYLSNQQGHNGTLLSIDLSSDRVRQALYLIDGVRQGQVLGALLGYQFERFLHDQALDAFIDEFRELAPLTAKKQIASTDPVESIAARNVVDGLALLRRWQQGKESNRWDDLTIPAALYKNAAFPTIERGLTALEDSVDAVSDVLVTESVYQAVQGKSVRSGASLDALSRGEAPPNEIEVVKSARSGIALTHRVMLTLNTSLSTPEFWEANPPDTSQARALAEPALNSWVGGLLGDPAHVVGNVTFLDSQGQVVTNAMLPTIIHLSELQLSPLDVLYMAIPSQGDGSSLMEQWLSYYLLMQAQDEGVVVAQVQVDFTTFPDDITITNPINFTSFLEHTRTLRTLITHSRGLKPEDFVQAGQAPPLLYDVDTLAANCNAAVTNFRANWAALGSIVQQDTVSSVSDARMALLHAAHFGIEGALPKVFGSTAEDATALLEQVKSVFAAVDKRKRQLDALEQQPPTSNTDSDQTAYQLERLQIVFGEGFIVTTPLLANGSNFANLWGQTPQGVTPSAVFEWLTRASRLRDRINQLQTTLLYADALSGADCGTFHVMQQPITSVASEKWVGLDFDLPANQSFPGGRLSLVANIPIDIDPGTSICGLLVDEWVEVVPNASEVTGVSFHFDAPQASAPQSILLAIHPAPQTVWNGPMNVPWDVDMLADVLLETYELTQVRMVTPDQLTGDVFHYLPALFFAQNDETGTTVSTDFSQ